MQGKEKITFRKKSGESKFRDSILFVLIFILCIATIVTMQIKSQKNKNTDVVSESTVNVSDEKEIKEELYEPEINVVEDIESKETVENIVQEYIFKYELPVKGEVLKGYFANELVYSKTMDDWRLHQATDILAPLGAKVFACEKGVVDDVYYDENYGYTVIIKHNEMIKTYYSNLSPDICVLKGNEIDKGTYIGTVGDSAMSEIMDEPHLHFAMKENNIYINPKKYISEL